MRNTISVDIDVDDIIDEISDEDLKAEFQARGFTSSASISMSETNKLIEQIYEKRRNEQDFMHLIDDLIYKTIGRIS